MTPTEIISDADVDRIHANANFGDMPKRQVINEGVFKYAIGSHCGHTQTQILREHGLITQPRGPSENASLTAKGKRYARAVFAHLSSAVAAYVTKQQIEPVVPGRKSESRPPKYRHGLVSGVDDHLGRLPAAAQNLPGRR
jgi:hypothetical protein